MPALQQPGDPPALPLPARPAGRQQPEPARGVADVRGLGATIARHLPGEPSVVRVRVRTEGSARAPEPGTELLVARDVLGLEARPLGGEAVGPAQDRELLPEGACGPRQPAGRVVRVLALHEAYLQVERGERRSEVGEGGGEPEPAAYPPDQPGAQRVVGDEEDPLPELAARDGL